jgi:hypothetical protein
MAEMGFELEVVRVGDLHHGIPNHHWNDAAYGGEGKEEGLGLLCPPHQPPPHHAILKQYQQSISVTLSFSLPIQRR